MIIDQTLKKLCDSASHLYFLIDIKSDTIIYANPAFMKSFAAATQPSQLLNLVHPEDRDYVIQNYESCRTGENIDDFECRIDIDDKFHKYKVSAVSVLSDTGQTIIGCRIEDITDLSAYIRTLNDHNKKKNSILNIIAHDLMGPIGIIQSLAVLMSTSPDEQPEGKIRQYVEIINRTSKKCINLIRNFINNEFLETAAVNLVKHRIDIVGKMRVLMEEYSANETTMLKTFSLHTDQPSIYIELDEDKFFQIINNLISNSLKFTREGAEISISLCDNGSHLTIAIADNGVGIPEKYHKDLFDKFTPARRKGLKGEQSIGLGMSIIKTIVEWHQGKIWFCSKEDVGTTFYIEIPKETARADEALSESSREKIENIFVLK
jgi:two-component system sensor histidine kinase VicK